MTGPFRIYMEDRDMSGHAVADGSAQTLAAPPTGQPDVLAAWCSCEVPSSPLPAGEILVHRVAGITVCRHAEHL